MRLGVGRARRRVVQGRPDGVGGRGLSGAELRGALRFEYALWGVAGYGLRQRREVSFREICRNELKA